ncbi:His-Xaa-Ser system radical SAM maturase HxsC [Rhizobium sp. RU35A]|uniref:His-Xaa-Ser system radical SAM maturase HxsC n=1 Tax=Rhizobium sp. RU35A TaxID=1907414 RepID=UPI0009541CA8|nr:His-Xaa-Ser system radical SAM maturase HxsC [Rhizobium sp. RU35A]SIR38645.1 His-Xaa-Ser system radical SAM maturase HxsC [Rhizobium sp. RU35A]
MIDLRLKVDPPPIEEPLVVRLFDRRAGQRTAHDAILLNIDGERREYEYHGFSLTVHATPPENLDGDVLLVLPGQASAHRLIRANSNHNTLLVTEQCDQLCVMCSQPPKKYHFDLFDQFAIAASLAPPNAMIGISGGEPLLHKARLFEMLAAVSTSRPDLRFHILTNAQHFAQDDIELLAELGWDRVLWGVPLYSAKPEIHDQIVGKPGAFANLEQGLLTLMRAGASVELRTVILQQNVDDLPELAGFITTRLSFISVWAIMQLERIGYGRMNWPISFKDTSCDFAATARAIDIVTARGLNAWLYNFPLCSVPENYRRYAPSTISDWKRKYLDFCRSCTFRETCGGFFQWYDHKEGFSGLGPI